MRDKIEQRLGELRQDFEAGQKRLANLERETAQVRETMLRIAGAIQVLEETLAADEAAAPVAHAAE